MAGCGCGSGSAPPPSAEALSAGYSWLVVPRNGDPAQRFDTWADAVAAAGQIGGVVRRSMQTAEPAPAD